MHAQKPKFGPFLWIYFDLSLSLSFFLCLSCLLAVLLPTLLSFFARNCGWLTFKERGKFNLQRVVCKQCLIGSGFSPKCYLFWECNSLTGLVRISKTRYCWKDLSLKKLMFINLYPASRGPLIFLDKSGRLKELKPRTNRVSRNQHILYSPLERILRKTTTTIRTHSKRTDQQHLRVQFTAVIILAWTPKICLECLLWCNQSQTRSSHHRNHRQRTVSYLSRNKLFSFCFNIQSFYK